ncbi:MAG: hypothetical protein K0R24_1306 [Gammaproteobacteria bacterium]|jgi:hypothetical protein|nr:hypothetical protein [Gammaproteobacteria bacterium]
MNTRNILFHAAVIGSTVSEAALACCGILSLYPVGCALFLSPPMLIASAAAFFSLVIEYDIYKQNVYQATQFDLKRSVAKRLLRSIDLPDNGFLTYYRNQKDRLHSLEESLEHYKNKKAAEEEISAIKKRIERMESLFIREILNSSEEEEKEKETSDLKKLADLFDKKTVKNHFEEKEKKIPWIRGIAFLAGISCVFVTLSSFNTAVTDLLSKPELVFLHSHAIPFDIIGVFISGLAGVGYVLLMYRTLSFLIHSEAFTQGINAIKEFIRKERRTVWDFVRDFINVCLLTLAIAIVVVATIATAGTWLHLTVAVTGTTLSVPLVFGGVSWICMVIPTFIYSFVNTIRSAMQIVGILYRFRDKIKKDILDTWTQENIFQFFNPFRVLLKIFYIGVFFGHILATGAASASDKNVISAWLTIVTNGGTEFLIDLHQLVENDDDNKCSLPPLFIRSDFSSDVAFTERLLKPSDNEEGADHQHNPNFIINGLSFILKIPAILWDFSFGGFGCYGDTWTTAKGKFFPKKEALPEETRENQNYRNTKWRQYEMLARFDEKIDHYQSNRLNIKDRKVVEKQENFKEIRKKIANCSDEKMMDVVLTNISNINTYPALREHRYNLFSSTSKPKSQLFLESVLPSYPSAGAAAA